MHAAHDGFVTGIGKSPATIAQHLGLDPILCPEQQSVAEEIEAEFLGRPIGHRSGVRLSPRALIIGRLGVPYRERQLSIISLIVDGTTDEIGALTGKLGQLKSVSVKTSFAKQS